MLKKNWGVILLAIILSLVFSKAMFSTYKEEKVMTSNGNLYLLQYGSYVNKNVMEENIKKLNDYMIYEHDNKYYVFLGAYTDLQHAKMVNKIFESQNIFTYIKNDYISDTSIINKISMLEEKLDEEEKTEKIMEINQKILDILKKQ